MRYLLALLTLLPFCAWSDPASFDLRPTLSVVKIHAHAPGHLYIGSGVVTGAEEVVTNCHVTRRANSVTVVKGAVQMPAAAQKLAPTRDLCLLRVPGLTLAPVALADDHALRPGVPVYFFGFPGGTGSLFADGTIQALHPLENGAVVETDAAFGLGASGGGVFDTSGRLVGIATFFATKPRGRTYAAPTGWIAELRQQSWQPVAPHEGIAFWEAAEAQRPYFLRVALPLFRNDWPEVLPLASAWSQAESTNPEAWVTLGRSLAALGRVEEARAALQRAVALQSADGEAWFHLARLAAAHGDRAGYDSARAALIELNAERAAQLPDRCASRC